jgi:hypothetical protein
VKPPSLSTSQPRPLAAHWADSLTVPEAAQPCPADLPNPANQLTGLGDSRLRRRIERAVRSASVPSQLGARTWLRPTFRRNCQGARIWTPRNCAIISPICHSAAGASGFPAHPGRCAQIGSPAWVTTTLAAHLREASASLYASRQIGGSIFRRPAVFLLPIPERSALMGFPGSGRYGLRPLAPPFLTGASHQRHLSDALGGARPFDPSLPFRPDTRRRTERFGASTCERPALSLLPMPIPAGCPLIFGVREVWLVLRPLARTALAEPANQHTRFDFLISARPFLPSSLSSKPRLRAERNGGPESLQTRATNPRSRRASYAPKQPTSPDLINSVRRSKVTRDSDFRTKSLVEKNFVFPSGSPGVRRPSKRLAAAHQFPTVNPNT